jgi:hypothetical protein
MSSAHDTQLRIDAPAKPLELRAARTAGVVPRPLDGRGSRVELLCRRALAAAAH